ncbi:MAG: iron-containing alcohol dehydrogenase [Clostridiales Family XIII bacterium]|jgi:alcohol dehydrogenase|nr:iron-containing alcohol dehydrogenase [Clostridiales Family XIII bacterium]
MLNNFEFMLPTTIRCGRGIHREIGKELAARGKKKPLLVTDKGLIAAGVIDKITASLAESGYPHIDIFDEVEPNPRDTTVHRGCERARAAGADALLAVGGGSSMDTAKGIGVLLAGGGAIKDYEGLGKVTAEIPMLIAAPTTVGTGSEVTFWAVIKDTKENYKMSIGSPLIAPKLAFLDADLIETLPPAVIAATGMDALTHAIEGYTATLSEPLTDACGLYAIEMIGKNLLSAVYGADPKAKENMLIASMVAGVCFGNSDIGGCHCMSEALGSLYDTPHGIANAVMLPYIMEYNCLADTAKFARVAAALGARDTAGLSERESARAAVDCVRRLNQDLAIPSLREIGAKAEDIDELAMRSATNVSVDSNTRKIGKAEFLSIFRSAMADGPPRA